MDRQEDLSTAPGGSRSHPEGNTEPMSSPRRDRGNDATRFSYVWIEDAWTAVGSNYIYVLLVFVPLGIVAPNLGLRGQTVFLVEVFAIIPLGAVISFATRSLTAGHRQSSRGLMHAASRNLVDVIVGSRADPSWKCGMDDLRWLRCSLWLLSKARPAL